MSEERGKKTWWWKAGPFKVFWDKTPESAVEVELTDITLSPNYSLIAKIKPDGGLYKALISAGWLPPCEGRWTDELTPGKHGPLLMVKFMMHPDIKRCRVTFDPLPEKEGEG